MKTCSIIFVVATTALSAFGVERNAAKALGFANTSMKCDVTENLSHPDKAKGIVGLIADTDENGDVRVRLVLDSKNGDSDFRERQISATLRLEFPHDEGGFAASRLKYDNANTSPDVYYSEENFALAGLDLTLGKVSGTYRGTAALFLEGQNLRLVCSKVEKK